MFIIRWYISTIESAKQNLIDSWRDGISDIREAWKHAIYSVQAELNNLKSLLK